MKPKVSVIVPTYNRIDVLKKCLLAILANDFNEDFEVVIIDDGSTDGTFKEISCFIQDRKLDNFFIFTQENGGPSKARNHGIMKAQSDILLIIGDDSIAHKNLLREHYIWNTQKYSEENIAILGYDEWSPEIKVTPFMKWIDENGLQFSYFRFKDEHSPTWGDLWTCNISLKRSFVLKYGLFSEDFPYAAWEDIELGWRLSKHGFQIKYNKEAIVYHHHPTTFESVKRRMICHGFSQMILAQKLGSDYHNILFRQPLRFLLNIFDKIITYSGILYILDGLCHWLESRKIIQPIFLAVLHHYKLKGIENYEKIKDCHC